MKRQGRITIDGSRVIVEPGPHGEVWFSRWELADLFGVYTATITANIKAIIRSGAVRPSLESTVIQEGNTLIPDLVGMDMIIALAFRLDSYAADTFRKWIIHKTMAKSPKYDKQHIVIYNPTKEIN